MPAKGKPAALERDGLSKVVRLQAERLEDSPAANSKQAHLRRALNRLAPKNGRSDLVSVFWAVVEAETGARADITAALRGQRVELADSRIASRLHSLRRLGLIRQVGRSVRANSKGKVWEIVPGAELLMIGAKTASPIPAAARGELRVVFKAPTVHLCILRPRVSDGVMRPSADGLKLHVGCLPDLIVALEGAEAQARRAGLIGGGE